MRRTRAVELTFLLASTLRAAAAIADPEILSCENLIKAGHYPEAKSQLESYSKTHPNSWQALYQLGFVNFRMHLLQTSVSALCKSILLNKGFADSHKILAYDLNMLGHPELAQRELELAIQYDPSSSESYYELGRIEYEQGAYSSAAKHLEIAKSLAPGLIRAYHNLGLTYAALGDRQLAIKNFEEGLKLNDRQPKMAAWPLIDYATYLNTQREFVGARDLLLRAIVIDSSWEQEFEELSKAYRGLGQDDAAIGALKDAIRIDPHKAELHYKLSRIYSQTDRKAEAAAELAVYQRAQGIGSR